MKKLLIAIFSVAVAASLFMACEAKPSKESQEWMRQQQLQKQQPAKALQTQADASTVSGVITETMNAGGYTYIKLDTGSGDVWAAVKEQPIDVGMTVTVGGIMGMNNFHSDTLDRTFELIYFGQSLSQGGPTGSRMSMAQAVQQGQTHSKAPASDGFDYSGITVPSGGLRVAQIYSQKDVLGGQTVKLRGKVVKFVPQVMGKNWLHIQDGTGSEGSNDITVTTQAMAQVGDVVTVEGNLGLNRDFGYGYLYPVLIEDASISGE